MPDIPTTWRSTLEARSFLAKGLSFMLSAMSILQGSEVYFYSQKTVNNNFNRHPVELVKSATEALRQ
jgi:hypothetical protein